MSATKQADTEAHGGSVGLKGIWRDIAGLPTVTRSTMMLHLGQQALTNVRRSVLTSLLTLVTISFALFFFAVFLLLMQNVRSALTSTQQEFGVTVYLRDTVSADEARALASRMRQGQGVTQVRVVDKATALSEFRVALGEQAAILDGLEVRNPLPQSVEVSFDTNAVSEETYSKFVNTFGADPGIEYVQYSRGFMQQLASLVRLFRLAGSVALALMLLVTGFIIANTIKLALFAHREEIEIMRLVGATDAYIRTPYLIEGAIQGVLGAALSVIALYLGFSLIDSLLAESQLVSMLVPSLHFLSFGAVFLILLVGILVGLGGSFFAVRKFSVD